jgi:CheY-like chemotaxis protein
MKRSYTILYVDDDEDDLLIISEAFERYTDHLSVVHAGNGIEGLKMLENMSEKGHLPCLLILDINMPVMDGKQMLQKLRARPKYNGLPVIVFSTSNSADDRKFALQNGAEFFSKPSGYSQLQTLVEQLVTKCRIEVTKGN